MLGNNKKRGPSYQFDEGEVLFICQIFPVLSMSVDLPLGIISSQLSRTQSLGPSLPDLLQTAVCLPDRREARTLTGRRPRPAGAAGCQKQWRFCSAGHLCPVASDKPLPWCPWPRLQEVTLGSRTQRPQPGSYGHRRNATQCPPSPSSCGVELLALP